MLIIQIFSIFLSVLFMSVVLFLVYKRRLREEYSLLWLMSGISLVVISLCPSLLSFVAKQLNISYPPSLIFVIAILFLIIIVLSQAVSITTVIQRDRDLAQKTAILEWRLEHLKEEQEKQEKEGKHWKVIEFLPHKTSVLSQQITEENQ